MASLRTWLARWRLRSARSAPGRPAGSATASHVAIIMDGNGRWAEARRLPVAAGHRAGAVTLRRVLEHALDLGLREVTVFAFSTENWSRPPKEVAALMDLFLEMIDSQVPDLHRRGARVRFVGSREGVPPDLQARIAAAETLTAGNSKMTLFIAFNYGGRREILEAAERLARERCAAAFDDGGAGLAAPLEEAEFRRYLYAPEMRDPELLIRTSGELRTSNFLLWQCAYAELYFSEKLWPDFGPDDLDAALAEYARRRRRFGGREAAPAGDGEATI